MPGRRAGPGLGLAIPDPFQNGAGRVRVDENMADPDPWPPLTMTPLIRHPILRIPVNLSTPLRLLNAHPRPWTSRSPRLLLLPMHLHRQDNNPFPHLHLLTYLLLVRLNVFPSLHAQAAPSNLLDNGGKWLL